MTDVIVAACLSIISVFATLVAALALSLAAKELIRSLREKCRIAVMSGCQHLNRIESMEKS